ncbi:hypothetical protein RclHR1_04270009 [Rhizophagus clarus]|nr:hypothetical protein RclHR1_04270009 [Rhizophagus clarus]
MAELTKIDALESQQKARKIIDDNTLRLDSSSDQQDFESIYNKLAADEVKKRQGTSTYQPEQASTSKTQETSVSKGSAKSQQDTAAATTEEFKNFLWERRVYVYRFSVVYYIIY